MSDKEKSRPLDYTKLLVVDDERSIRTLFKTVLAMHFQGVRVDAVVNGMEAVEAFRDSRHAVILMDIHMPVMDGVKAYDEILRLCTDEGAPLPAFVFCTGYEPPDKLRTRIGTDTRHCVLRKPVRNADLFDVLVPRLAVLSEGGSGKA
jgi:CheY-like chemotaxis protein